MNRQFTCIHAEDNQTIHDEASNRVRIGYIAGVLPTENIMKFERSVFRILRGKVITKVHNFTESMMNELNDTYHTSDVINFVI